MNGKEKEERRIKIAHEVVRLLGLPRDTKGLAKAIEDPKVRPYAEALMTLVFGPNTMGSVTDEIGIWKNLRNTPARNLILKEFLSDHGVKWCFESLDLDEQEKIDAMCMVLGGRVE